jgi:hypothetical protein
VVVLRRGFFDFPGANVYCARADCTIEVGILGARWQSGHAAACKAVYAGSIPTLASSHSRSADADVAKLVDAADFDNWSARRETRGAEPLKLGERYRS